MEAETDNVPPPSAESVEADVPQNHDEKPDDKMSTTDANEMLPHDDSITDVPQSHDKKAEQTSTTNVGDSSQPLIDPPTSSESKSITLDVENQDLKPDSSVDGGEPSIGDGEPSSDTQTQNSDAESQSTDVKSSSDAGKSSSDVKSSSDTIRLSSSDDVFTSSSDTFYPARQPISSIPKSLTLETSTPSSSRNSSPIVDDASSSQDKDIISSDGPTSCSTPASNDSEDMVSAHGPPVTSSTPSRPLDLDFEGSIASQMTMRSTETFHSAVTFVEPEVRAPIVGYEIMEQRAKFTVFRIHVQFSEVDSWFIFRRYTDFVRLNEKLRLIYPTFRLSLPPKRWFGSNFDYNFLEDRQLGLQAFLNNITGHKEIVQSDPVREFLCLDDPPGAHDSLEESRALCESLEEAVYNLRKDLAIRDTQLAHAKLELAEARHAIASLLEQGEKAGIKLSCPDLNSSSPSMDSDSSTVNIDNDSTVKVKILRRVVVGEAGIPLSYPELNSSSPSIDSDSSTVDLGEKAGIPLSCPELNSSSPSIDSDSSTVDFMSRVEADQVRPLEQPALRHREHRTLEQSTTSDVIKLAPETNSNIFSSPNCNINNSTEYSLHTIASAGHGGVSETTQRYYTTEIGDSVDSGEDMAVPAVAKVISVT